MTFSKHIEITNIPEKAAYNCVWTVYHTTLSSLRAATQCYSTIVKSLHVFGTERHTHFEFGGLTDFVKY